MKKEDLNDVVERLEALDSLAQLFKNLWFGKIKNEIKDEKVKAYLMVFEDAFPGLDQVVSFVSKNAKNLSDSPVYQVKEEFELLSQSLLNREIAMDLVLENDIDPGIIDEKSLNKETDVVSVSEDELEDLAVGDQGAIDDLFTESDEDNSDSDDLETLLSDEDSSVSDDLEDLISDENSADLDDLDKNEIDIDELLDTGDEGDEEVEAEDISDEEMAAILDDDEPSIKKKTVPKKN